MKKKLLLLFILILTFSFTGCSGKDKATTSEQLKTIRIQTLQQTEKSLCMDYSGTVDSKQLTSYSFKTPGQINKIYVKKGDTVHAGDKLAELYKDDLKFQLNAAKSLMDTAEKNINKASYALNYAKSLFEKVDSLYSKNSISKNDYEQAVLQKSVSESELAQAKSQYQAAKTDYEYKLELLNNAVIYAENDGIVVSTTFDETERVGAFMPVVIIRSEEQIINIGIPQSELKYITLCSKAKVDIDGEKAYGTVTNIAEAPDSTTRTYTAEIKVEKSNFRLGSIAKVSIDTGKQSGIWIPMTAVFSDGEYYVYIVRDNIAFKKTIEIEKIDNDLVLVTGLNPGELLAVSGMKNLDDGSKVKVLSSTYK
ncbi:MAG: efflux RND transporter periplasmic adaptor subunit [Ignavibacteriales bacterium]